MHKYKVTWEDGSVEMYYFDPNNDTLETLLKYWMAAIENNARDFALVDSDVEVSFEDKSYYEDFL